MGSIRIKEKLMAIQKTADYLIIKTKNQKKRDFYLKVYNKAVFKLKHFFNFECTNYNNLYWYEIKFVSKDYLRKFLDT